MAGLNCNMSENLLKVNLLKIPRKVVGGIMIQSYVIRKKLTSNIIIAVD